MYLRVCTYNSCSIVNICPYKSNAYHTCTHARDRGGGPHFMLLSFSFGDYLSKYMHICMFMHINVYACMCRTGIDGGGQMLPQSKALPLG